MMESKITPLKRENTLLQMDDSLGVHFAKLEAGKREMSERHWRMEMMLIQMEEKDLKDLFLSLRKNKKHDRTKNQGRRKMSSTGSEGS